MIKIAEDAPCTPKAACITTCRISRGKAKHPAQQGILDIQRQ